MNYVYRYIDKADNIIKYIGIVCRDTENALERRIYEHANNDSWCQGKSWKIEYITVPTKNDALLIYGVGGTIDYIKSNDTAKQLPDKHIKALDKLVDNLNEEEKMKHEVE